MARQDVLPVLSIGGPLVSSLLVALLVIFIILRVGLLSGLRLGLSLLVLADEVRNEFLDGRPCLRRSELVFERWTYLVLSLGLCLELFYIFHCHVLSIQMCE